MLFKIKRETGINHKKCGSKTDAHKRNIQQIFDVFLRKGSDGRAQYKSRPPSSGKAGIRFIKKRAKFMFDKSGRFIKKSAKIRLPKGPDKKTRAFSLLIFVLRVSSKPKGKSIILENGQFKKRAAHKWHTS